MKKPSKKRLQHKVRPKTVLGPCGGRFSDDVGAMLDSKTDQKRNLKAFKINVESNLNLDVLLGGPEFEVTPPRGANAPVLEPGGRLQRGVPGLRTSEF